jgi:L-histidine Nalpha-methyltransferase / hercynylcysteine S-oxide synthase
MPPPPPPPPPVTEYLSSSPSDGIIHLTDGLKDIKQPSVQVAPISTKKAEIIDIRSSKLELSLKDDIYEGLKKPEGERTLPTLLLYDEAGLNLFQDITYLDEYYLTNAEIQLLEENAFKIAKGIPDGAVIVELGSG